jgi:23S rRNA (cytosine1962-C5)-methyltransferase
VWLSVTEGFFWPENWKDYELIDAGDGERLERWGEYRLRRPDPVALWPKDSGCREWQQVDGKYHRSSSGGGSWEFFRKLPESWEMGYGALRFEVRPTGFKHMGLFPEQAANWDWMTERIRAANRPVSVLNLFGYTGGATVAAAVAGASVCHVDASKSVVTWARQNVARNIPGESPVRWIADDAFKFMEREIRRGKKYDGILMDPPSYGRGTGGEVWKFERGITALLLKAKELMSDAPLFFLLNAYTTGLSPISTRYLLESAGWNEGGTIETGELALQTTRRGRMLPCGVVGRWVG